MPGTGASQCSRRPIQSSYCGTRSAGAASKLPIMISASSSLRCTTREPHRTQKLRPEKVPSSPLPSYASRGQIAKALKAEPDVFLQSRQWHNPTRNGSPRTRNLTEPQRHPPSRIWSTDQPLSPPPIDLSVGLGVVPACRGPGLRSAAELFAVPSAGLAAPPVFGTTGVSLELVSSAMSARLAIVAIWRSFHIGIGVGVGFGPGGGGGIGSGYGIGSGAGNGFGWPAGMGGSRFSSGLGVGSS